jgi:hypothetical protein
MWLSFGISGGLTPQTPFGTPLPTGHIHLEGKGINHVEQVMNAQRGSIGIALLFL